MTDQPIRLQLSEYASPVGLMLIVYDAEHRLRSLDFADHETRMKTLLRCHNGAEGAGYRLEAARLPTDLSDPLDAYFAGRLTAVDHVRTYTAGTEFQRAVWAALRRIPAGTTTTYGALAQVIGRPKAVRAVGLANGANPIAVVVPCHRVIGKDGTLTGYGGGLDRKHRLLAHEGVRLTLI